MNIWLGAVLAALVSLSAHAATIDIAPRIQQVVYKSGHGSVQFKQSIKGYKTAQYRLNAKAGQLLTVDFKPSNTSAYFNITAKGADYALFNGSMMGNHFLGSLPADGEYSVQVYLMRNAARRNEVADYNISLILANGDAVDNHAPFDQNLALQGISFHVQANIVDGKPTLRIEPKGLEIDNSAITLLAHASDLLESLAVISANFADEFDGSQRHVAVAIKQLSALAEIVICRVRDNLDPQRSCATPDPEVRH